MCRFFSRRSAWILVSPLLMQRSGHAYSNLGEKGLAAANIRKAFELSAHVSEHERLYIESHYYQFATGDLIKASRILELSAATFPNDEGPRTNLAVIYSNLGRFDRSLELAKEAVRVGSHDAQSYANLVNAYVSLNKPDEANAVAAQAMAQNLDSSALRLYLYDAAALQQNSAGMQMQLTWASGEPGVEDDFLNNQANNLASSGQVARARELTRRQRKQPRGLTKKRRLPGTNWTKRSAKPNLETTPKPGGALKRLSLWPETATQNMQRRLRWPSAAPQTARSPSPVNSIRASPTTLLCSTFICPPSGARSV